MTAQDLRQLQHSRSARDTLLPSWIGLSSTYQKARWRETGNRRPVLRYPLLRSRFGTAPCLRAPDEPIKGTVDRAPLLTSLLLGVCPAAARQRAAQHRCWPSAAASKASTARHWASSVLMYFVGFLSTAPTIAPLMIRRVGHCAFASSPPPLPRDPAARDGTRSTDLGLLRLATGARHCRPLHPPSRAG